MATDVRLCCKKKGEPAGPPCMRITYDYIVTRQLPLEIL
jgi:hypothetical protein